MQDDFDDGGMGLPDDEVAGGSEVPDIDAGDETDAALGMGGEPGGRLSGRARARASSGPRKAAPPAPAAPAKKPAAKKLAAKKASGKISRKARPARKKGGAKKKGGKSVRKASKKGKRKAGPKKARRR